MTQPSPLSSEVVGYVWRQLAVRAGAPSRRPLGADFTSLGVPVYYAEPDQVPLDPPAIIVKPCSTSAFHILLDRASDSLDWLPIHQVLPCGSSLPFSDPIPVLFWAKGCNSSVAPFAELHPNGGVLFHADIVAATFFMLSRWEETVLPSQDKHGRFPAKASVAYKQGFLDRPVVDEYALILREWLKVLVPGWQPTPRPFSMKLSHDVDNVRSFPNLRAAGRKFGADLIKKRRARQAWHTALEAAAQTLVPDRTTFFKGIQVLAQMSRKYHTGDDTFYFMTGGIGPQESDYDVTSPLMRRCISELRQQGFEVGLHAGYRTLNNPERLAAEKVQLDAVLGETRYGGRQHYLRFQVPDTWRHWEQVGLEYDATMTYADHEGFRCGTCHPFRPFDVEQNRELDVWEKPLIVMDQTLRRYRALAPEQGEKRILELAQRCKQVEGTFSLLWHNSSLAGVWRPWLDVYTKVLKALASGTSLAGRQKD